MRLILLRTCLTFFFLATTTAQNDPLVCTDRADAVAVVNAACQLAVDCRFELSDLTLGTWDVLLSAQTYLMVANDATQPSPLDARFHFWPANYVTLPLLVYDPGNTSGLAIDCAFIVSNIQTDTPPAIFTLMDTLFKWLYLVSDSAQCSDINQIPIWDNSSGTPSIICQCQPGKVCNLGGTSLETLLAVVGIMDIVLVLAITLVVGVTAVWQSRLTQQMLAQWEDEGEEEEEEEEEELKDMGNMGMMTTDGLAKRRQDTGSTLLVSETFFGGDLGFGGLGGGSM